MGVVLAREIHSYTSFRLTSSLNNIRRKGMEVREWLLGTIFHFLIIAIVTYFIILSS